MKEMKDESAPDLSTLGFEPGTQWSEVELYTMSNIALNLCKKCDALSLRKNIHCTIRASTWQPVPFA